MSGSHPVLLVSGETIARYGFNDGHQFGPDRHDAFMHEFHARACTRR